MADTKGKRGPGLKWGEPPVKTSLYVPRSMFEALQRLAERCHTAPSSIIRDALGHYLFLPSNIPNREVPNSNVSPQLETVNCAYALPGGCKVAHVLTDAQTPYVTEGDCADAQDE